MEFLNSKSFNLKGRFKYLQSYNFLKSKANRDFNYKLFFMIVLCKWYIGKTKSYFALKQPYFAYNFLKIKAKFCWTCYNSKQDTVNKITLGLHGFKFGHLYIIYDYNVYHNLKLISFDKGCSKQEFRVKASTGRYHIALDNVATVHKVVKTIPNLLKRLSKVAGVFYYRKITRHMLKTCFDK